MLNKTNKKWNTKSNSFHTVQHLNALIVFEIILLSCSVQSACSQKIVSENDGVPVMMNARGCKLIPYLNNGSYGLGTFYIKDAKVGETVTHFIVEETIGKTYKASKYEIIENTPQDRKSVV
jgi:hypothetical protein